MEWHQLPNFLLMLEHPLGFEIFSKPTKKDVLDFIGDGRCYARPERLRP